jgi:hypothetical protein
MMHSFPTKIHSIKSQAALNHLQPTLIAGNTLKLCDFKMCLHIQDLGAAQLKKAWVSELPPKDPSYLVVTLTGRAEIEQLTCKVIRECLKLKLAPLSVGKNAEIVGRLAKVLQLQ